MSEIRRDLEKAMDAPGAKISKQKANYQAGMKKAHCSICKHFEPAQEDGQSGSCEIVAGRVDPRGWCKYYEHKKG